MLKIIITNDGSHSLLNSQLNETYHSIHGARQESLHVFIKNGFDFLTEKTSKASIKILEIGFGTGLNAFLTAKRAQEKKIMVEYTSIEAFPLEESIWQQFNYATSEQERDLFNKLHRVDWDQWTEPVAGFMLRKLNTTLQLVYLDHHYFDLIYFDAFAPNKQPEMWERSILHKTIQALTHSGVFVTYCAKGSLKRDLISMGATIETMQGPPGKREMIRASVEINTGKDCMY